MTVQAGRQMRTRSRYGLRGVRLGEASNPGPLSKRRRVLRSRAGLVSPPSDVLAALERDLIEEARHMQVDPEESTVVDLTVEDCETVPASGLALREAGRQMDALGPRVQVGV